VMNESAVRRRPGDASSCDVRRIVLVLYVGEKEVVFNEKELRFTVNIFFTCVVRTLPYVEFMQQRGTLSQCYLLDLVKRFNDC
jgi:hypothetical protein